MRIIFGAQACGFGPVSKMVSLAKEFNTNDKIFIGNDVSFQFVNRQKALFSQTIDRNKSKLNIINKAIKESSCGVVVMDHDLAFHFYLSQKRYYFIDSLFGFWYSRKNENTLARIFSSFSEMNQKDKVKNYNLLKVHEQKLFAHFYSEMSFIQNFFGVRNRISRLAQLGFINLLDVNPIVDNYNGQEYLNSYNGEMLINLGGIENFLVDSDTAAYLKLIEKLSLDLISLPYVTKIYVCSGSYKNPKSQTINGKKINFIFADKVFFHKLVNAAQFYLSSPGLTAFYEALYYKHPTIYLPEQHASQYYNINHIKKTWLKPYCLTLFDVIGEKKISPNDFRGSSQIVKYISKILNNNNLYNKFRDNLCKKIEMVRKVDLKTYQQQCTTTINQLTVSASYVDIVNIINKNEQNYEQERRIEKN
ncbi:MAG: hypothetical protein US98_C0059G0004 [Parcubacteria group bacterium GW2011_GWC1_38_6]|uniref:Uncharacterized protein n=1 Tax=Candidatus Daviesbacteria bacterium GW2011_GWB1_41_5 TaxID=1618429 RepID=A0A0G0WE48_9BACT|nr:MAG: hypothetical protein US98_C0059G0004 [Parcubacteria group bacterium GW2011_GWC1_38_6]KKS11200.1 MAG: hypothetical protein UU67_C0081G0007 [Candidatus Daviesbacteria bacterium GW2011_GWB1_41_5]